MAIESPGLPSGKFISLLSTFAIPLAVSSSALNSTLSVVDVVLLVSLSSKHGLRPKTHLHSLIPLLGIHAIPATSGRREEVVAVP